MIYVLDPKKSCSRFPRFSCRIRAESFNISTNKQMSMSPCQKSSQHINLSTGGICRQKRNPEVRKYDGFAEARNTARSVPRTRRRVICVCHVCCMDLGVPGNREQPKLPIHTLRKTNITMEKDPLKMYFLLNMGIFHLYMLVSQRVSNILSENNEGPVHRNAYRCCAVARRGKSWICSKL